MTEGRLFTWPLPRVTRTAWRSCCTSAGWSRGPWTGGASPRSPRLRGSGTRTSPTSSSCGHRGTVTPWPASQARSSCRRSSRPRTRILFYLYSLAFRTILSNALIHRTYGFQMHTIRLFIVFIPDYVLLLPVECAMFRITIIQFSAALIQCRVPEICTSRQPCITS